MEEVGLMVWNIMWILSIIPIVATDFFLFEKNLLAGG